MIPLLVIAGPTASGKTALAIEIAKKIDGEVISADSMQVYKEMNIGTAKPDAAEMDGVPHHLLDIIPPDTDFSLEQFVRLAHGAIRDVHARGKVPILAGGTGLYIKALLYDYEFEKENNSYDFSKVTDEQLISNIKELDDKIEIDFNNRRRLERTLTRLLENSNYEKKGNNPLYDFTIIGLTTDRDNLYKRIDKRVLEMIDEGLLDEAKKFYEKRNCKSLLTGIGYKEIFKYFDKELTLEEAVELIQKNSRHYAKRQYTFFNNQFKNKEINWFETNYEDFSKTVEEVFNYLLKNNHK